MVSTYWRRRLTARTRHGQGHDRARLGLTSTYVHVQLVNRERLSGDYIAHEIAHGDNALELATLQNRKVPKMMTIHKSHGIEDRRLRCYGDQRSRHNLPHAHVSCGFAFQNHLTSKVTCRDDTEQVTLR